MRSSSGAGQEAPATHAGRVARYGAASAALARLREEQLGGLVDDARGRRHGPGGTSSLLDVEGVPVFVKAIPLTARERLPGNVGSTANLFGLPTFCQYGVGSPGFGAWRELAANTVTTGWVLTGRSTAFPLMYHWRVLPGASPPTEEFADIDRATGYWGGSSEVRERFQSLAEATASLVLFLEFIPEELGAWLGEQLARGPRAADAAVAMVERRLCLDLGFLNAHGIVHFDAHFGNLLTDGRQLYIADLGLATSARFDLSRAESGFMARHRRLDVCLALTMLVNRLVENSGGADPPGVAAVVRRYAPLARVVNAFYTNLFEVSRATPYPAAEIERAAGAIPQLAIPTA